MRKLVLATVAIGLVAAGAARLMQTRIAEAAAARRSYSVELREGQIFPTMVFPSLRDGRPFKHTLRFRHAAEAGSSE